MEQDSKITWESPVESAEQMLSEHTAQNKWIAELRKQLAETEETAREMIGKMADEDAIKLADMCLDEMEKREYSVLRICVNLRKGSTFYILDVTGYSQEIASMLMYLGAESEPFDRFAGEGIGKQDIPQGDLMCSGWPCHMPDF